MRNVFIYPDPKPLPPRRKGYPFAGAAPSAPSLTVFKTRRIMVEEERDPDLNRRRPDLAWMYGGTPVVVNKITFLRKSSYAAELETFKDLSPDKRRRNPLFSSTPQLIILGNGPGPGQLGAPTIVGGRQRMQIFIGGVEVTDCSSVDRSLIFGAGISVGAQPLKMAAQTIGRWSASFDLFDVDGTYNPQLGQTVLLQEDGVRLMIGCINSLTIEIFDGVATFRVFHVGVVDKTSIFDHRVVLQRFFLAGTDIADVIRSLFTDSTVCNPPLQNEGITLNGVPASLGPLTQDLGPYLIPTVTQVMDDLATDLAGVWFIDTLSDLTMTPITSLGAAPFGLDNTTPNFRRASMNASLAQFRTKQYAVSDRNVTPATNAPAIVGTPIVESWTLPQALANSLGYLPLSIVTNFPMLFVSGLKVNGVVQPVYIGTQYPPINFRHVWWYFPQTNNLIPPNAANANPFPDPPLTSADPSPGDVVEISYLAPQQAAQVVQQDPLSPTFGTCGSGVYEVVEQVKGVDSQDVLNQIATTTLEKFGALPKAITFETDRPGLAVGQSLPVNIPALDLTSTTLMITAMEGQLQAGRLLFGSRMRWQVTATNTQDLGNWIKFMERLVRRTQNAIPVNRYEEASWVLDGSSSVAGGLVDANPYPVRNTGQLFLAFACANNGPTDQSFTIDVVSDAQGSIISSGPTPLVIPAGSTALIKVTQFLNDPAPLYLVKDDILRINATYLVTGPNPVAAANVTFGLRWFY